MSHHQEEVEIYVRRVRYATAAAAAKSFSIPLQQSYIYLIIEVLHEYLKSQYYFITLVCLINVLDGISVLGAHMYRPDTDHLFSTLTSRTRTSKKDRTSNSSAEHYLLLVHVHLGIFSGSFGNVRL